MIVIRAASRLHFGLLHFPLEELGSRWTNFQGEKVIPARRYGGVGLMVESPGLSLRARPSSVWQAEGPLAERALEYARQFTRSVPQGGPFPLHLMIERSAPEHGGLGTGTQLGLAVARALALSWGTGEGDVLDLAQRVGRGRRSALGLHGFAQGGFLVEAGQGESAKPGPLVARVAFPEDWPLLLILPVGARGYHGQEEIRAFERLHGQGHVLERTEALCRLVLLGLLPALAERDFEGFGEALYDFNGRVGAGFAPVQSGTYTNPGTAELISFLRREGIHGVGQSSWGPTVFAVLPDAEQAHYLAARLGNHFALGLGEVLVTRAANQGASAVMASEGREASGVCKGGPSS
jgi:beta-ribofuranosylaminobenzene 5'-phosphate synthase